MSIDVDDASHSRDSRIAIQAYAHRLQDVLQDHIGVISQSGDPMSRSIYQAATLQLYDRQGLKSWSAQSPAPGLLGAESPQIASPVPEQKLFSDWRTEGYRKPLLIVAPAGSGKSCLLESFALQMARELLYAATWRESDSWPIGVPLLISVARMSGTPLEEYLSRAETDLTAVKAILSPSLLSALREQRRLVLLIDGFDEVPSAQHLLVRSLKRWKGGFAITSRPGHGERRVVPEWPRQHTLREMTADDARVFVGAYFTEIRCAESVKDNVVKQFDSAWSTHFGRLLRRPLYLKAWCDYVVNEDGNRFPASLGDLAQLIFLRTLDARGELNALSPAERNDIIDGFVKWFGRLGLYFATKEFTPQKTATLRRIGLLGNDCDKVVEGAPALVFESIGVRCGMLIHSDIDEYEIPKVPLVEYVLGRHLADDAVINPSSPQILLATFRRWVWRLDRHAILDYTFDALWNSQVMNVAPWGNALLLWAKQVGNFDGPRDGGENVVTDDCVHPFGIAALRWRTLHPNPSQELIDDDVEGVTVTFSRLIACGLFHRCLCDDLMAHIGIIERLISDMVDQRAKTRRYSDAEKAWNLAILDLTKRLSEEDAAALVIQFMKRLEVAQSRVNVELGWCAAIAAAVKQLGQDAATDFVLQQLKLPERRKWNPEVEDAWRFVIIAAVNKVGEDSAASIVVQLIERQSRVFYLDQVAWRHAIWLAAARIRQEEAAALVVQWIEKHDEAYKDEDEDKDAEEGDNDQEAWRIAIRGVAARIHEEDAATLVAIWISEHGRARADRESPLAWREAITGAASQIPTQAAAGLVAHWMEEHDRARGDEAAQAAYLAAIAGAAMRVARETVVELVVQLVKQYSRAQGNKEVQEQWSDAIEGAAGQVAEETATEMVLQCMEQHDRANRNEEAQAAWRSAIIEGAGLAHEDAAADLLGWFLERLDRAQEDSSAQRDWLRAIEAAASRVKADRAEDVIFQLIERYDQADKWQYMWHNAIEAAANRVSEDIARRNGRSPPLRLCNALLTRRKGGHGLRHIAAAVVANSPSIAIVSFADEAGAASDTNFRAVIRRKQSLDERVMVTPPLVRAAFIETKLFSLENSLSGAGLAAPVHESIGQLGVDIGGIRSDIDVLKQFAEFGGRCRDFERRLQDIALRVEGRPPAMVGTDVQNLDLSASEIPADASLIVPEDPRQAEQFIKHLRIFYEIGKLEQEPVKRTYKQIAEILTARRRDDFPKEYPSTKSSVQRWCTKTLPAFFRHEFELESDPELFQKFGANNSNCGLTVTGMRAWTLTRDRLRSERLPPFND